MRHALLLAAALAAVACSSTGEPRTSISQGDSLDALRLMGSDGQSHSLGQLVEKGPVYLYFIKKGCPTNDQALPWYGKVYEGLDRPAAFVGVINGDRELYQAWNEDFDANYLVLFDPEKAWIDHFGAERSPWVVEVQRDGSIGREWHGYSGPAMIELDAALAETEGVLPTELDYSALPESNQYG